jgi:poly-gamma-glutamate synthesis protein (capsule biosynthesis protein)
MEGNSTTFVVTGDLYVQRDRPASIFERSAGFLRAAGAFFGNLEAAVTDVGAPTTAKAPGGAIFKSDERMLEAYTHAGLSGVGLANNHSMNYGVAGILRTIDLLDGAGIAHAGGGRDVVEARRPAVIVRGEERIALLSYTSVFTPAFAATSDRGGVATVRVATAYEAPPRLAEVPGSPPVIRTTPEASDLAAVAADVRRAKERGGVVLVLWHWGVSAATGGAGQVVGYQREVAHAAIDAGADLVAGHHPHEVLPMEMYRGRAIFYSLGNFAFDLFQGHAQTGALAHCTVRNGVISEVALVPVLINEDAQPEIAAPSAAPALVERLRQASALYATEFDARDDRLVLVATTSPVAAGAPARGVD